ncbi:MAG TPA: glycosyltransferase family 39 protein, partial [Caldilineaceae bacterium]|nr:glycosyltransferase family 39 protein [Caldilineaceae bacterium]
MQPRRGMVAVAGLYLAAALAYAVVAPPLEGFDALAYFKYAGYLHRTHQLPVVTTEMVEESYEAVVQPPLYFAAVALATAALPMQQTVAYAQASDNPYHDKSLSLRQTITLPTMARDVRTTFWVARLVSILGGLVTVLGAYALVRTLLPDSPWLAVAVAAITGLNPQFLFTSVTITNDAWVPAVSVVTLWLLARATTRPKTRAQDWLLAGCCAGLAALTKYSCLLLALPALVL